MADLNKKMEALLNREIENQTKCLSTSIPSPSKNLKLSVIVPAKNESQFITNTLTALYHQMDIKNVPLQKDCYEVIVLCHNCSDDTFDVVNAMSNLFPDYNLYSLELKSEIINNVGAARRLLMYISASRLHNQDDWILSTDADTVPDKYWLLYTMNQPKFVDLLCGKILIEDQHLTSRTKSLLQNKLKYQELKMRLECLLIPNKNNPWPKHNNNSGPSLAVRKGVYLSVDGIPAIPFLEDIALYNRVRKSGYDVRHDPEVIVKTSGRLNSKTTQGLGSELKNWTYTDNYEYKVEGIEKLLQRFSIYRNIEELFYVYDEKILEDISVCSFIPLDKLKSIYQKCSTFEEMVIDIENELDNNVVWNHEFKNIKVRKANTELEDYLLNVL